MLFFERTHDLYFMFYFFFWSSLFWNTCSHLSYFRVRVAWPPERHRWAAGGHAVKINWCFGRIKERQENRWPTVRPVIVASTDATVRSLYRCSAFRWFRLQWKTALSVTHDAGTWSEDNKVGWPKLRWLFIEVDFVWTWMLDSNGSGDQKGSCNVQ